MLLKMSTLSDKHTLLLARSLIGKLILRRPLKSAWWPLKVCLKTAWISVKYIKLIVFLSRRFVNKQKSDSSRAGDHLLSSPRWLYNKLASSSNIFFEVWSELRVANVLCSCCTSLNKLGQGPSGGRGFYFHGIGVAKYRFQGVAMWRQWPRQCVSVSSLLTVPAVPAGAGLLPATCVISGGMENWAEIRKLRLEETRLFIKYKYRIKTILFRYNNCQSW